MQLKKIITVFITYVVCVSCIQSQEAKASFTEAAYPLLLTDLERYNLKGNVKSVRAVFDYDFNDTLTENQKLRIRYLNDLLFTHISYAEVNGKGFFVKTAVLRDSVNEPVIDTIPGKLITITKILSDIDEKSTLYIDKEFSYPVINPHPVRLNKHWYRPYDLLIRKDSLNYKYIQEYVYTFNENGYPVEEKEYSVKYPYDDSIPNDEKQVEETVTFIYDENNRIVSKQVKFDREGFTLRIGATEFIEEFDIPIDRTVHYEYVYDDNDRVNEISFFVDNRLFQKETYTYHEQGWVAQREKFIPGPSIFPGVRWRIIQQFNEHGDIIKARSYDNNEVLHNKRFYDYKYDGHNNWIKCKIYLEGVRTDPPTAVARRIIEYYNG